MLSFDRHQHTHVAGRVGLHYVQLRLAIPKVALQGLEALGRGVDAVTSDGDSLRFRLEPLVETSMCAGRRVARTGTIIGKSSGTVERRAGLKRPLCCLGTG